MLLARREWRTVIRIPVVVDTDNSGPAPAEDHIAHGTSKVFSSMVVHQLLVKIQRSRASRRLVSSVQQSRNFQRGKELQGQRDLSQTPPSSPERHDSTTHIDLKLHAFLCRVCLV